ncbi:4-hydroxythreonine-4-phosphate dehydrogenase PdxA [Nitratireductor aquimarinus]|uniref:4-hydroxythreonine-4-phosphate dehydrogenase PdxA n=1 Tax=Nitratireductor aquimarinus TaxID=889300 RepID=UPI002936B2C5|nr:4-hydroxythreonine-4-phosphate dehydrogenase PdxA [Nitratireductor aquimarinus]MDV2965684.1 4-hydroxythreonine-4-phosphate dehydrogenase PdxA [Nitratireductor aquimarinus]
MQQSRIAFAIGDPAGISPELSARILADEKANLGDLIVIGDQRVLALGARQAGLSLDLPVVPREALEGDLPEGTVLVDMGNCDPENGPIGEASMEGGRAALDNFAAALKVGKAGLAKAVFFTPFNKHAMRLAKSDYVDEIGFIDATIEAERSGREFNVLDEVWNARVTSHIPLRDVADKLSVDRIYESLKLTAEVMEGAGIKRPRIGVAALNPHAGDGRNFGWEDEDILLPAVERAQQEQLAVTGPIPSDTVFVRAIRGEFDAVMTMYHDQGQIAMKLLGFDRGVTLIAGYPFPIVTPAHGTAYDIAGKGIADTGATFNALALGRRLGDELGSQNGAEASASHERQAVSG